MSFASDKFVIFSDDGNPVWIMAGTVDPSAVATDAPIGSSYQRNLAGNVQLWQKQDDGLTTNWTQIT